VENIPHPTLSLRRRLKINKKIVLIIEEVG